MKRSKCINVERVTCTRKRAGNNMLLHTGRTMLYPFARAGTVQGEAVGASGQMPIPMLPSAVGCYFGCSDSDTAKPTQMPV